MNRIVGTLACLFVAIMMAGGTASGQNVGIGTAVPLQKLDVNGSIRWGTSRGLLHQDQGSSIDLGGSGSPYIDLSNDGASDYDVRIQLTGNDALNIAGGNVGIGIASPSYALDVSGDARATYFRGLGGTSADPTLQNVHAMGLLQHHDGNAGYAPNSWHQVVLGDNGTWNGNYTRLYLHRNDGSYTNEVTVRFADATTSSGSLKTNVTDLPREQYAALLDEMVNRTRIVHYEFKHPFDKSEQGNVHLGLLAEEAPAEIRTPNADGIELGDAIAYLLAGIKALKAENDAMRAELDALKAKLAEQPATTR